MLRANSGSFFAPKKIRMTIKMTPMSMGENVATVVGETSSRFISDRLRRFYAMLWVGFLIDPFLALLEFFHRLAEGFCQFGQLFRPEEEHQHENDDPPLGTGDV